MAEIKKKHKYPQNRTNVLSRKAPSVKPKRHLTYVTADKTTCTICPCFPKEPYIKNKKLDPCLKSPVTLYELAANVVNELPLPDAFTWSESEVVQWLEEECGLPEYKECILKNYINGRRLLFLEDASKLPDMNIRNFEHIKIITAKVRLLFGTEMVKFNRSLSLPLRKPLTHCTWFKSRTGPAWGIRQLWNRCDVLRRMEIINPEPTNLNHWDLVWYQEPDYPRVKFARTLKSQRPIKTELEPCREYLAPRKFILQSGISESKQLIWMERVPEEEKQTKRVPEISRIINKDSRSKKIFID